MTENAPGPDDHAEPKESPAPEGGVPDSATRGPEGPELHDQVGQDLTVVLLGRVVTRIGTVTDIHAGILENLFAADLAFLQDLYRRINQEGHTRAGVTCPDCGHAFAVDLAGGRLGES